MNGDRTGERFLDLPLVRVIEHAVALPGVTANRYFSVLWPLWQVEVAAVAYDEQPYDLIDRFVVRAVAEGHLTRPQDIAGFLGVSLDLVSRCARFLELIGHLTSIDDQLRLTDLGAASHQRGVRLVRRESRQTILFESFTAQPLSREYYRGSFRVLSSSALLSGAVPGYWFPVSPIAPFRSGMVSELKDRADRHLYNVPQHLLDLEVVEVEHAFLPVYIIETIEHGLLAYTEAAPTRDEFLEDVFRQIPAIAHLIAGQRQDDPERIWTEWLAEPARGGGLLRRRPDGGWRSVLRASAFGKGGLFPVRDVGSFKTSKQHFIQVWCDDEDLRRRALLERSLAIATMSSVRSRARLAEEIARLSELLELTTPEISDLYDQAVAAGLETRLGALDELE
jgi:hypothetical protein